MSEKRPWLWPTISSLHPETQLYTQRRSNAETEKDYKFTIQDLALFLQNEFGFFIVHNPGASYDSDMTAAAAGVPIGGAYKISIDNIYGIPTGNGGVLKIREE